MPVTQLCTFDRVTQLVSGVATIFLNVAISITVKRAPEATATGSDN